MKLGGANDDEKVKLLIEYLRGMNDALNIPHCIQHYGTDSYPCLLYTSPRCTDPFKSFSALDNHPLFAVY